MLVIMIKINMSVIICTADSITCKRSILLYDTAGFSCVMLSDDTTLF